MESSSAARASPSLGRASPASASPTLARASPNRGSSAFGMVESDSRESGFYTSEDGYDDDLGRVRTPEDGIDVGRVSTPDSGAVNAVIGAAGNDDVDRDPTALSDEETRALRQELVKVNEEMNTLRLVLQAKVRRATELKRNLGISQIDEIKAEVSSTIKAIQESNAYQKTSTTLSVVTQRTGAAVSGAASSVKQKLDESSASGRPRVSNAVFREAGGKVSAAFSATGTYVNRTYEDVKATPTFKAVGTSVNATWMMLKGKLTGDGNQGGVRASDSFISDVAEDGKNPNPIYQM